MMNLETDIVCDRTKGCYEAIKVSPAAPRQKGSFSEVKLLPPPILTLHTNQRNSDCALQKGKEEEVSSGLLQYHI